LSDYKTKEEDNTKDDGLPIELVPCTVEEMDGMSGTIKLG